LATIEILESAIGPGVHAEAEGRLVDACDDARAPVGFSCRSARCGTCLVDVLGGRDLLAPAAAEELETLAFLGAEPGQRLACQVVVLRGPGRVRLRWAGE
jgi:ferredoxin